MNSIKEAVDSVKQRVHDFEGRYTDHFPRWTLRDYAQVSVLVGEVEAVLENARELRARVAELETEARLGRMVREMPAGACLHHVVMTSGRSFFAYSEPRPNWGTLSTCSKEAETAAEAIEAVRSKP
jgi:hypothetical protein